MCTCENCKWHGTKDGEKPKTCTKCQGSGYVNRATRSIFGVIQQTVACDECRGVGVIIEKPCSECHGKMRIKKKVTQSVDIPPGIDNEMTLRISGEWHTGLRGNKAGDLYVICRVDQSYENLVRQGVNIFTTVKISPPEAVLGTTKKIRFSIIGERELKIGAGTPHGKKIQLTWDGMHAIGKKSRWDLIITLEILVPGKLSKTEKELYEKLAEITADNH